MTRPLPEPEAPTPLPLPRPALVAAAAAALLAVVAAFLPWARVRVPMLDIDIGDPVDGTSWPMLGWVSLLAAVAAAAVVALLLVRPAPNLWLALPVAGLLMTTAALISLVRVKASVGVAPERAVLTFDSSLGTGVGLWLTLGCGLALVAIPLLGHRLASVGPAAR